MNRKNYETINQRQKYVQQSGKLWERLVMNRVNQGLKKLNSDIRVIDGSKIKKEGRLWQKLAIPVGKSNSIQKIWGDIDLIIVDKKENPLGVISCKTSLHGRFSETLFYAVVLKELDPSLRVLFATPDKGRQQKSSWQSEWGTEEKPTKDRLLGSHYLDGVYIENKGTQLGGMIKPLDNLAGDIVKWSSFEIH